MCLAGSRPGGLCLGRLHLAQQQLPTLVASPVSGTVSAVLLCSCIINPALIQKTHLLLQEARQAWRRLPTEVDAPLDTSGPPICRPLTNVTQLLTWQPPCPPQHDPCACTLPLQPVGLPTCGNPAAAARPKLLVCHDMAGGYHEDRHPAGDTDPGAYALWHWGCVDVFVYFSHHLVTIPPVGWIRAAHRHGVQVRGYTERRWIGLHTAHQHQQQHQQRHQQQQVYTCQSSYQPTCLLACAM
jgi:endo-beta-N-acetylglucosaminidase D